MTRQPSPRGPTIAASPPEDRFLGLFNKDLILRARQSRKVANDAATEDEPAAIEG